MGYKYRWIWAIGLIIFGLIMGYINDFQSLLTELDQAREQEKNLQLSSVNTPTSSIIKRATARSGEVNSFIKSIDAGGMVIKSIHSMTPEKLPQLLQIVLEGNYFQALFMIRQLEKNSRVIQIKQFSLKMMEGNILQMNMEILLDKGWQQAEISAIANTHSPFCQSDFMDVQDDHDELIYPIREMKMVGHLQRKNQHAALIMMPDHVVKMVYIGDLMGVEKGKVIAIEGDDVKVKLQNKIIEIGA